MRLVGTHVVWQAALGPVRGLLSCDTQKAWNPSHFLVP